MPIRNPTDLKPLLARGQRLLGLDLGEKTIGLALSDTGLTIASPLRTLKRGRFAEAAEEIRRVMAEFNVGGLIVGLPINMDGSEGPRAQSARQFAANLLAVADVNLAFWDERLSTAAVTRTLLDADMSRKRRGQVVDKLAAAYILQGALDRMAWRSGDHP